MSTVQVNRFLWVCILLFGLASAGNRLAAGPLWTVTRPHDAALTLAAMPDISGDGRDELLAGFDSGRIVCWSSEPTSPPLELWHADLGSSVLALLPMPDVNGDGKRDLVAADVVGRVTCVTAEGAGAGTVLWSFSSASSIASLTTLPDQTGDGVPEVLAGGSEQVLYLRNGRTGGEIWTHPLDQAGGYGYIHRILAGDDLNNDSSPDLVLLDWNGVVRAFSGADGAPLWAKSLTGGFTDALARMGDLTGDGRADFVAGGNNRQVRMVSGLDGAIVWSCALDRPVRSAIATTDVNDDGTTDCFAATAGGTVACISGAGAGGKSPLWTADMGDVCRALVSPGDLDHDGKPDVVACAENGQVAAFSGTDGTELGQWQGPDVVRTLTLLDDVDGDGIRDIAAACLDGTVALLPSDPAAWTTTGTTTAAPIQSVSSRDSVQSSIPALSLSATATTQTNATRVPILLYHDVLPVIKYPYGVSVDNFRAQMDLLAQGGYTTVYLDQVADWIEGKITLPEKSVCITFDGPYEGQFLYAWPILKERGFVAQVYITADWIGTVNHADWHELRKMDASGIQDIENHTINHPNLTSLTRDGVIEQITLCNESIRRHLNGKIARHHAYPGGAYNSTVMGILAELGIRTATTVEARAATRSDNLLALPRFGIVPTTSLGTFKNWIGYVQPPPPPLPYKFTGTVGTGWHMPSFGDVDAQGRLWVCDYTGANVRVFETDGSEASFSPITEGRTEGGQTRSLYTASGIAVTPSGEVLVTIADYITSPSYFGLFRYNASNGQFIRSVDLPYRPGDVDCDAAGHFFIVDKVTDEWHVYGPDVTELAGSPVGPGTTNHIQRGISVLPDASKVYVISESDGAVHVWQGGIDGTGCHYTQAADLATGLGGASGGVDVMDTGTVLVGDDGQGRVLAYDANRKLLGGLFGGDPALIQPRGTAFTPDGSTIWVISRSGFVQRWDRILRGAGLLVY